MSNFKQRVPDEVLWMIVEHVDDRHTLYALLTTSRIAFYAAVKKLWTDPFGYSFKDQNDFLRLLKYVLAISPCRRREVAALRQKHNVKCLPSTPRKAGARRTQKHKYPFVDYLGMIRHARFRDDRIWEDDWHIVDVESLIDITRALPWIICDGQFGQLSTLVLLPSDVSAYLGFISSMTNLTRIIWDPWNYPPDEAEQVLIRRFVQTYMEEHGERGSQLHMMFDIEDEPRMVDQLLEESLVDIYRILAPFPPGKTAIVGPYDWARCVAHMDEMDFSTIRKISLHWFDTSLKAIWPRCRNLEELYITEGSKSLKLFGWPTKENCLRYRYLDPMKGRAFPPPPLRVVDLSIPADELSQALEGLAYNFGRTLEAITLDLCDYRENVAFTDMASNLDPGEFDPFVEIDSDQLDTVLAGGSRVIRLTISKWDFPKLRRLTISDVETDVFLAVDQADVGKMPKLEELIISGTSPTHFFNAWFQHGKWLNRTDVGQCEPWTQLPELRMLVLKETVAAQLNPASFASWTKLEELELTMDERYMKVEALQLTWSKGWPAFSLPSLRRLTLSGHAARSFELAALRHMPALQKLSLDVGFMSEFPGELQAFLRCDASTPAGHRYTPVYHLEELEFYGRWIQESADYVKLLKGDLLPKLKSLYVAKVSSSAFESIIQLTCCHPKLSQVTLDAFDGNIPNTFECLSPLMAHHTMGMGVFLDSNIRFSIAHYQIVVRRCFALMA